MTLIVAGVTAGKGWIVSDTLITGGTIQLRDREYQIKCLPAKDRRSLVAFSGDAHNGAELIEQAAAMPSGQSTISVLCEAQAENPEIDFLYMFLEEGTARLFKISNGSAQEAPATYIGEKSAFEQFQHIRHATEIDPVPKSFEHFMFGSRAPSELPDVMSTATVSMLRMFLQRTERDVGGWAVPYVLIPEGAYMCGYAHAVSDPILDKVLPGAVVPHGTAEAGGYGLSVTELSDLEGMVIYRRQTPGGLVLVREERGYRTVRIDGAPNEFRAKASDLLGKPVDIFFGEDVPDGLPESIAILRDDDGQPAAAIAKRGNNLSFSVLNIATAFRTRAKLDLSGEKKGPRPVTVQNLTLTLADDRNHVKLQLLNDGKVVGESALSADEMDAAIAGLGQFRAALNQQVRPEPDQSGGAQELLIVDPAWRTVQSPHAEVDGVVMRLRHLGLGWVSFLLPRHEGRALGRWLADNCAEPAKPE
ncbi:hypothetical protein OZ411_35445 [Bradyrhizobium sp. Arg237L]|uniref:hypothetical protein n=1 Tax=Bradyrhizobium sp. Arg237L TaxID=3003352 RepID=UPI00249F587A|nr:hypothetical protein [Bradyrhizobium sp. Arg237L]MDI4238107.1 hypothetical protein [Bradyrhizobium sp. Arg237L]